MTTFDKLDNGASYKSYKIMGNVNSLESNLCRYLQSDREFPVYVNAIFLLLLFVEQIPRSLTEDLDRSK